MHFCSVVLSWLEYELYFSNKMGQTDTTLWVEAYSTSHPTFLSRDSNLLQLPSLLGLDSVNIGFGVFNTLTYVHLCHCRLWNR